MLDLGELDEARRADRARDGARPRAGRHRDGRAGATCWSTWLAYFAGEPEAALGHAQQAVEIAERIGELVLPRLGVVFARPRRSGCGASGGRRSRRSSARWRSRGSAAPRSTRRAGAWRCSARRTSASAMPSGRARWSRRARDRARAQGDPFDETLREPGAGAGPARLGRPRRACGDRGGARARARAGARHGREGVRAADPRRARRAGAPERRPGRARARAPRGAPPVHGDRRDRPRRAPGGRAGDAGELAAVRFPGDF